MCAHAADIDDGAALLLQRRQTCFHAVKRRVERDVHYFAPLLVAHVLDRTFPPQRRVVDQAIDTAVFRHSGVGERLHRLGVGDIAEYGDGLAAGLLYFRNHGVGFRLVGAHIDDDGSARLRQLQRDGAADIASGAGDDSDFSFKFLAGKFFAVSHVYPRRDASSILPP